MAKTATRTPAETSPALTIAEVAERWQVSEDSVRRSIANGDLRAFRIGRLIRIRERDVARAERPVTPAELAYSVAPEPFAHRGDEAEQMPALAAPPPSSPRRRGGRR